MMPSPIPTTAYPVQPAVYKAPARDMFGAGASGQDLAVLNVAPPATAPEAGDTVAAKEGAPLFGKDGFTLGDFLDIINPLQHIPVVSTVYRAITGDKIGFGPLATTRMACPPAIMDQESKFFGALNDARRWMIDDQRGKLILFDDSNREILLLARM